MNKESNSLKNISTVLLALLILGLAAGTASASLNLGTAGNFTILSNTGITAATPVGMIITGNIGTNLVANPAITGVSCTEVSGKIYILSTAGYAGGHDSNVTCLIIDDTFVANAVGDMGTAYTYYSGGSVPHYADRINELGTGTLSGLDLAPGVYKWTSTVDITDDITLNGSDTTNGTQWIFQVAQTLDIASGKKVILTNGANPENIVWVVAGATTLGTTSEFNGTILDMTAIHLNGGTTLNGRALAQTAVTLDGGANTVTIPSGSVSGVNLMNISALSKTTLANRNSTYFLNLTNNGTASDTYTITTSNPDSAATVGTNTTLVTLETGASKIFTLNVTNTAAGIFRVNVTATSGNDPTKSGYINTTTTVIVAGVNLTNISAVTNTTLANANSTYFLNLTNNGTATDTYTITTSNPNGAATVGTNITSVTLAAGASKIFTLNVTNTASGTFRVNVTATSVNDSTKFGYINTTTTVTTATTTTTTTSGGGSGGSSGGSGVSTSEPFDNIAKSERYDKDLIANTPVTYTFKASELGIYEIAVTGKENENDIALRVEVLKGTSKLVTVQAPGIVYKNVNVWAGTQRMKEAIIRFRVENSWLGSNSLAGSDIKMVKWDGSQWVQLETTEKTKDDIYTYYEAKTDAFGMFAITGLKGGAVVPTATTAAGVTETPVKPTGTATAAPTQAPIENAPGFELVLTAAALCAIYLSGRKRR